MSRIDPKQVKAARSRLLANLAHYGIRWDGRKKRLLVADIRESQRRLAAVANRSGLKYATKVARHMASPDEVDIRRIEPRLIEVTDAYPLSQQLWSYALSFWSVPVSAGYGRRMRFLVVDQHNDKLIGVLGLCDPLIGSRIRDDFVGWNRAQKHQRLYNCLTAYVLGAVPPYNRVLGSKLVAQMALAPEVQKAFQKKYTCQETIIAGQAHDPHLVMVDTYGAFQKSAIYTRLQGWQFVGYTSGQSHVHITANGSWDLIRQFVPKDQFESYEYGQGSNWKLRTLKVGLAALGLPFDMLSIGWKRAYYVAPLISNLHEYLTLAHKRPKYIRRSREELTEYWRQRWALPRLDRLEAQLREFGPEPELPNPSE